MLGMDSPDPPRIRDAKRGVTSNLKSAHAALERPLLTNEQIEDAIRSAEFFIAKAKELMHKASD